MLSALNMNEMTVILLKRTEENGH